MNRSIELMQNLNSFDPLQLTKKIEKSVIDGDKRKYRVFRLEPFYRQIATARGSGCNLKCNFCWTDPSRDDLKISGKFYSPEEVYDKLIEVSSNEYGKAIMSEYIRISGCEPTIGKDHLLSILEIVKREQYFSKGFLLETNGILLGTDENYVKDLSEFKDRLIIRLSFKAGTPELFEEKTGARKEFFDYPFYALHYLQKHNIPYALAAMSKDPEIMPSEERMGLLKRITDYGIDNLRKLEEEGTDLFGLTVKRLTISGINLDKLKTQEYLPIGVNEITKVAKELRISHRKALSYFLFRKKESNCVRCNRNNPWHGHGTENDLDERFGGIRGDINETK